jgi:tRNA dimethylallyltransferase
LTDSPFDNHTEARPRSLVALVGPTAIGKTALSIAFAQMWQCERDQPVEVISADSRQVYRGLDIGTAKPSVAERHGVPHHLIDLIDPSDDFTLADFQDRAYAAIDDVLDRGELPLLVGGTGLYDRAVVDGIQLPRVPPDRQLRAELESLSLIAGFEALHRQLAHVDPVAAGRIDPRNVRRVVRALEVTLVTGRPFSESAIRQPRYAVCKVGLTLERAQLYRRIDARVDTQVAAGLLEETRSALERGCAPTRPALAGFGYRQMVDVIEGRLSLTEAIQRYKYETHRFARQQYTWFRLDDPSIVWLTVANASPEGLAQVVGRIVMRASERENNRSGEYEYVSN